MSEPAITHWGHDVALRRRRADGRALFVYLDPRTRAPLEPYLGEAWPHELRRLGWGIAEIKAAIAALPLDAPAAAARTDRAVREARPRALLHAHYAAGREDEDT